MPITIDLKKGQLIEFSSGVYEFTKETRNKILVFEHEDTGHVRRMPQQKFEDLHSKGKVKLLDSEAGGDARRFDNPEFGPNEVWTDDDDAGRAKLTDEGRRSLALQFYTRKWDELDGAPLGDKGLQALITDWRPVSTQLGYEPKRGEKGFTVKPARLRFCINNCGEPGNRPLRVFRSRRGKTSRRRFSDEVEQLLASATKLYWSTRGCDYNDAYAKFHVDVNDLNDARRARKLEPLRYPTRPEVLRRRIRKTMCFDNWARKYSKSEAWRKFKGNKEHQKADWPLELVIMDHTVFDSWMVYDSKECLPLGRPGLTIAIDVCTRMILGYLLSFEPPSVYTIQTVLKRVNKNKSYVKQLYPHIEREWDGWGRPNEVLVDQAWENKSPSFRHSLRDLGIDLMLAPADTPQFKSIGERFFDTMNTKLAHKLAGAVPYNPHVMRSVGLDPKSDAVLSLDELDALIHETIIGYHYERHDGIGAVPARIWHDKIAVRKRHIIRDITALDRLVGRVECAQLTTAGIRFKHMVFHHPDVTSELLDDLVRHEAVRTQSDKTYSSGRVKVVIKWNPADCGSIVVWNRGAKTPCYVTLPNVDRKFFDGLSFWHWQKIRDFARVKDLEFSSERGRWKARDNLRRQWEGLVRKLPMRDSADARRGLAFSQGTFDHSTLNEPNLDKNTVIIDEKAEASTDGMNKPEPVPDETYAATIDGGNEKILGRRPTRKTIAKRKATIDRKRREAQEEQERLDQELQDFAEQTPPITTTLQKKHTKANDRAGVKKPDSPGGPVALDPSQVPPLAVADETLDDLPNGDGWEDLEDRKDGA